MRDLREDLDPVWRSLRRRLSGADGAPILMFTSALQGEGVTSMAASFACLAARRSDKPVWLVDLDLRQNQAYRGFERGFARDVGAPGRAYDASLQTTPFFRLAPPPRNGRAAKLLTAHDVEGLPLLVTRFRGERLEKGQKVSLCATPDWWQTLRQMSGWIIIDAPALQRSAAAMTLAANADGIILVVEADRTTPRQIANAHADLQEKGGQVLGAVMNQVKSDALWLDRRRA
ncbi:MAG: hypothetical protein AAGA72_10335 [Pseudomonadota bacterium]